MSDNPFSGNNSGLSVQERGTYTIGDLTVVIQSVSVARLMANLKLV